jgi:hypothetical protein
MLLMSDRIWQTSARLRQLLQYLKPKVSSKISAQLLLKYKLIARGFLSRKKCALNVGEIDPNGFITF